MAILVNGRLNFSYPLPRFQQKIQPVQRIIKKYAEEG